jgi:23S rRNA pseudouridine2605 synthase
MMGNTAFLPNCPSVYIMSAPIRRHSRASKSRRPSAGPKRRGSAPSEKSSADASQVRLQKLLASAGIGSRRKCEELIAAGRVTVDGRTVTALGTKVDPEAADVRVDCEPLPRSHLVYYLVNKPLGVVSTTRDPDGRPRVIDLAPDGQRLFMVGRLDVSSEGLILVTNDGELANLLAHPRYGVEKTYQVQVAGLPDPEVLERLRRGVHLAEGLAHAKRVWIKSTHKQSTILEMVLDEGRNREVRRLLAQVGHKVLHLRRIALGPLRLGELPPGECRPLRREEVRALREAAHTGARGEGRGARGQGLGARDEEGAGNAVAAKATVAKKAAVKDLGIEVKDDGPDVRQRRPRGRDQLAEMKTSQEIGAAKAVKQTIPRRPMVERTVPKPALGKGGTVIGQVAAGAGRKKVGGAAHRGRSGRPVAKTSGGRRKQFQDRREQRR